MKVELDIFSGRPNPSWELSAAETEDFRKRLRALPRDQSGRSASGDNKLGYRGLIVTVSGGDAEPFERIVVSGGVALESGAGGAQTFLDQERALEQWLLDTGKSRLDADIYNEAANKIRPQRQGKPEATNMRIEDAMRLHEQQLMAIPGVNGVGIGESNGQPVILIMVKQLTPDLKKKLPSQLEGYGVKVEVVGEIRAQ